MRGNAVYIASERVMCQWQLTETESLLIVIACCCSLQEDINVTSEVGRQHILGQSLQEKKGLLRAWILRDHRPTGVSVPSPHGACASRGSSVSGHVIVSPGLW